MESGIEIDLLFTDVVMPGSLKSSEMARMAKERMPNLAVLFTSGYTENSIVHGGRLDAGVELLSKPCSREALARKVRHVLGNQQQRNLALENAPSTIRSASPDGPVADDASLIVLLVEDDGLIRTNTMETLEDLGHRVIEAATATEALAKLKQSDIDVLVTDLGLPDMSGAELAVLARHSHPSRAVIFATGNDRAPEGAAPDAVLLSKPYDSAGLRAALRKVVNRK